MKMLRKYANMAVLLVSVVSIVPVYGNHKINTVQYEEIVKGVEAKQQIKSNNIAADIAIVQSHRDDLEAHLNIEKQSYKMKLIPSLFTVGSIVPGILTFELVAGLGVNLLEMILFLAGKQPRVVRAISDSPLTLKTIGLEGLEITSKALIIGSIYAYLMYKSNTYKTSKVIELEKDIKRDNDIIDALVKINQ